MTLLVKPVVFAALFQDTAEYLALAFFPFLFVIVVSLYINNNAWSTTK